MTLTATVSAQFGGIATGSVAFSYGSGTSLGTVTLSGNKASLMTTVLPLGTDSITAVYGGDPNFAGSTSNTLSQEVDESDSLGYIYSVYDFWSPRQTATGSLGGVADAQGNVYGITGYGGANSCYPPYAAAYGCGAIVKWDTSGKETVLHNFDGTDGAMPMGGHGARWAGQPLRNHVCRRKSYLQLGRGLRNRLQIESDDPHVHRCA